MLGQLFNLCVISLITEFLLLGMCHGISVSIRYTHDSGAEVWMADSINLTISSLDAEPLNLKLQKVDHMSSGIPLEVLAILPDGSFTTRREISGHNLNTAFYQDLSTDAVMQVEREYLQGDNSHILNFKGQFVYKGKLYNMVQKTRNRRDVISSLTPYNDVYTLQEQSRTSYIYDYIVPENSRFMWVEESNADEEEEESLSETAENSSSPLSRVRRQAVPTYYIDIVAVVDFQAYSRFYSNSKNRTSALTDVLEYYTFIMTGVDLLYQGITSEQYRIRVKLIKVVVAENEGSSQFTEKYRVSDTVDANSGLDAFSTFAIDSGRALLGPNDHAMLFTGLDLTFINNGSISTAVAGLAYVGTLCSTDGESTSIIEDMGDFTCDITAAHELGHSLSALHDQLELNNCSAGDNYIMTAVSTLSGSDTLMLNRWKFSNCTVKYFTDFIQNMKVKQSSVYETCLIESKAADPSIPDVGDSLPGLKYSPDEQCKMLLGNSTSQWLEFGDVNLRMDPSLICLKMCCENPDKKSCTLTVAARGTVCGDGKLCLSGKCVAHPLAPRVEEKCVFGDWPSKIGNLSCNETVNQLPWKCYENDLRQSCCYSCKGIYRLLEGCEYGDKIPGCTLANCSGTSTNEEKCCGTCNYGTPITTNAETTLTPTTTAKTPTTTATILIETEATKSTTMSAIKLSASESTESITISSATSYMTSTGLTQGSTTRFQNESSHSDASKGTSLNLSSIICPLILMAALL